MVVSRLYSRSIVVYNEVNMAVQEQLFLSAQDEDRGCTVDKLASLTNPVSTAASFRVVCFILSLGLDFIGLFRW